MIEAASTGGSGLSFVAGTALKAVARLWFLMAVVGQWAFVYYIVRFYGGTAVQGDFEAWNKILAGGYVAGEPVGNVILAAHLLLAAIITVGGSLQLVPQIRARALPFHRWNGRLYIVTAFAISIAGLYLVWTRGTVGGIALHVGISLNGVLILICAATAWRYALARDIVAHRRWALRTFVLVSGVWFFRVGFMLWIFLNQGPVGHTEDFQGPFDIFWAFACYLLPLAVLEIYLRTQDRAGALGRFAMAAGLLVLTAGMGVGIFMATMLMWLPRA